MTHYNGSSLAYLCKPVESGYHHPFSRNNQYLLKQQYVIGKASHRMVGGSFLSSLGKMMSKVAPTLINHVLPIGQKVAGEVLGQLSMKDNKLGKFAQGALKVGDVINKNKEIIAPIAGTLATMGAQQLSNRGHDNTAQFLSNTSQGLLNNIMNRQGGQGLVGLGSGEGLVGLNVRKGGRKKGGSLTTTRIL